jgi:hypothetical protein
MPAPNGRKRLALKSEFLEPLQTDAVSRFVSSKNFTF